MSVQVAKSSTPTAGKRTPLQVSGTPKSNKAQQQNAAESEKEKDTPTKEQNPPSTSSTNPKVVGKGENSDESTDLKKGTDKKNTNADNQTTGNSNSAKDKTVDDKKKDDKKKDAKEAVKKDDKKQENGVNEGKEGNKANGHKDVEKKIRETPRQKDLREQREKEEREQREKGEKEQREKEENEQREKEEKQQEVKKLKDAADELRKSISKTEEDGVKNQQKESENVSSKEEEKELETSKKNQKEPETPKKGEKKSRDADSVTPKQETQIHSKPTSTNKSVTSLTFDNYMKGLNAENEEMESLLFDAEVEVNDDGGPIETSTPGKVLKFMQSPPKSASRSYERLIYNRYGKIHIINSPKTDNPPSIPLERPQTLSYRSISGRKSIRPAKEYSFHGSSLGTYRKINTDLDCTTSSLNATAGSDVQNSSLFSLFGRGKKRERTPPPDTSSNDLDTDAHVDADVDLSPKSPKKPRLDFSDFLGIVATPVTLLRSKLSKAKIQSSTPNGKVTSTTSKDEEDGVESVSVIATEDPTVEVAEAVEVIAKEMDVDHDEDELIENVDEEPEEAEEPADLKKPLHAQQLQQPVSTSGDSVNKRRMCNVM